MSKLSSKISLPIILAGLFAITIFIAIDYEKLDPSFYVVLILLTLFVFFFGFATGQNLASPIKKLLDSAKEISEGNLDGRIYLETKDELAELAKVFNKLAGELETSQNKEKSTEKSVDIKVHAKTQQLQETINALEQKVKNRTIELEKLTNQSKIIQTEAKTKELETNKMKQELQELKQKLGKYGNKKTEPIIHA